MNPLSYVAQSQCSLNSNTPLLNRVAFRKQIPISSLWQAALVRQNRRELAKATQTMLANRS